MGQSKEYRRWINRVRSHYGKKNGVIDGWLLDNPWMENKDAYSKRNYKRQREKAVCPA